MLKSLTNKTTLLSRTMQQYRGYTIKIANTIVGKNGLPRDPGHVAIYTTDQEQKDYGLNVCYGQNAASKADQKKEHIDVQLQIEGHQAVPFKSYVTPSAGFSNDKEMLYWNESIEMGPLTSMKAKILAEWMANANYEVTCVDPVNATNCVEEVRRVLEEMLAQPLPYVKFETPQALGHRIKELLEKIQKPN